MKEIVRVCLFESKYLSKHQPDIDEARLQNVFGRVENICRNDVGLINLRRACNVAHYLRNSENNACAYIPALENEYSGTLR